MPATITKLPIPNIILTGCWNGVVYLIATRDMTPEQHESKVQESINAIINEFDGRNHDSVSLRETRRELIHTDWLGHRYSMVSFRVRDSY